MENNDIIESKIASEILKEYKPILTVYYPHVYHTDPVSLTKLDVIKSKFDKTFKDIYLIIFIPTSDDDIHMELLSVIKSKFIKDNELEKYIKSVQETFNNELYTKKYGRTT